MVEDLHRIFCAGDFRISGASFSSAGFVFLKGGSVIFVLFFIIIFFFLGWLSELSPIPWWGFETEKRPQITSLKRPVGHR